MSAPSTDITFTERPVTCPSCGSMRGNHWTAQINSNWISQWQEYACGLQLFRNGEDMAWCVIYSKLCTNAFAAAVKLRQRITDLEESSHYWAERAQKSEAALDEARARIAELEDALEAELDRMDAADREGEDDD